MHAPYASAEDKIAFVHVNDEACEKELGFKRPSFVFFRKFESEENVYEGKQDKDSLIEWVKPLMVPTVFEFTEDEIEAVFGQQNPTILLFRGSDEKDAAFMETFKTAATTHKGKMLFSYSDVSGGI